jgi:antitoxin component of MazEF toxin-antitoxin module
LFRPRVKLTTVKKASRHRQRKTDYSFPKLIRIGNSVGLVISKPMLKSICWNKGDFIEYQYDDTKKVLFVRNLSAEQREYDALHGED